MDCYYYKCSKCGFVHQVPAYWSDYNPEQTTELPHMNLETKEMCDSIELALMEA